MKAKDVFVSWDIWIAAIIAFLSWMVLPNYISNTLAAAYYTIGITGLTVVFAFFFAALALIVTSSNDEFVKYLHEDGTYNAIIASFKFTLVLLFIGLMASIVCYGCSQYCSDKFPKSEQSKWFVTVFIFIFFYGLLATIYSAKDSIEWLNLRVLFLTKNDEKETK